MMMWIYRGYYRGTRKALLPPIWNGQQDEESFWQEVMPEIKEQDNSTQIKLEDGDLGRVRDEVGEIGR